ncbi:MAG TPA: hypothetical protein VN451_10130 [Chitinophagaceae bacterium]|nr:hypothetical protein [Chitinophagaceae bacterium]
MGFEQDILHFEGQPLTQSVLMSLLRKYRWPHNKIRELEKKGLLTPLKRSLYITGPGLHLPRPSVFLLANHIYGPSYVSMEAALSHWEMIPEKVTNVSSVTTGYSRTFSTPVGLFTYVRIGLPYFAFGLRQVKLSPAQTVLMAGPEKAICDLIIVRAGIILRSISSTMKFLLEDLRIEREALLELNNDTIMSWVPNAPKKSSIEMLAKTLEKL